MSCNKSRLLSNWFLLESLVSLNPMCYLRWYSKFYSFCLYLSRHRRQVVGGLQSYFPHRFQNAYLPTYPKCFVICYCTNHTIAILSDYHTSISCLRITNAIVQMIIFYCAFVINERNEKGKMVNNQLYSLVITDFNYLLIEKTNYCFCIQNNCE